MTVLSSTKEILGVDNAHYPHARARAGSRTQQYPRPARSKLLIVLVSSLLLEPALTACLVQYSAWDWFIYRFIYKMRPYWRTGLVPECVGGLWRKAGPGPGPQPQQPTARALAHRPIMCTSGDTLPF